MDKPTIFIANRDLAENRELLHEAVIITTIVVIVIAVQSGSSSSSIIGAGRDIMRVEFLELAGEVLVVGGAVFVFRESPHELADLLEHLGLDFSWYGVVLVDVPRKRGERAGGLIGILLGEDRVPLDDVLHRLELVRQVKGHEVGAKVLVSA